jgi:hypothetical protein
MKDHHFALVDFRGGPLGPFICSNFDGISLDGCWSDGGGGGGGENLKQKDFLRKIFYLFTVINLLFYRYYAF